MSPEASAIWMILAIKGGFWVAILLVFWRCEVRYTKRLEKVIEHQQAQLHDVCSANGQLHEANAKLMAIIQEQDSDSGEEWKS